MLYASLFVTKTVFLLFIFAPFCFCCCYSQFISSELCWCWMLTQWNESKAKRYLGHLTWHNLSFIWLIFKIIFKWRIKKETKISSTLTISWMIENVWVRAHKWRCAFGCVWERERDRVSVWRCCFVNEHVSRVKSSVWWMRWVVRTWPQNSLPLYRHGLSQILLYKSRFW